MYRNAAMANDSLAVSKSKTKASRGGSSQNSSAYITKVNTISVNELNRIATPASGIRQDPFATV